MTGTTGAAQPTKQNNRERHDFTPIKGSKIWYRRAHPRAPVEMVVSHGGGTAVVYELTRDEVRARLRELAAFYLDFPINAPAEYV